MKITIDDMKVLALEKGGTCKSEKYINAKTKLEWHCKLGHTWNATPNHIKNGTWCPICSQKKVSEGQKLDLKTAQNLAIKKQGKCLSKDYKNARTKLIWQCEKEHVWEAVYDSIRSGSWCPICKSQPKIELDDCINYASKFNGFCLSKIYINAHSNLEWQCHKGHKWLASPNNVKRGQWCPTCKYEIISNKLKLDIKEIQDLAKKRGGLLISKIYNNAKSKLIWQCSNNHNWKSTYDSVKRGTWCPICSSGYGERATKIIFEELFKLPFEKERPLWLRNIEGNQMEIDGYNSELKLGFEHHGQQHYKRIEFYQTEEDFIKRKRDDLEKERLCRLNNVTLIIVPEIPNILPLENAIPFIIEELKKNKIKIPNEKIHLNTIKIFAGEMSLFEEIKLISNNKGGKLLTVNYMGAKIKHVFECANNHIWEANLYNIKNGSWCKKCIKNEKLKKLKIFAYNKNGECLSTEYVSSVDKLKWKCNQGHIWDAQPSHILNGTWCPFCGRIEQWKKRKISSIN